MMKALATRPVAQRESDPTSEPQTKDSSLPLWKHQQGRVQGALWRYVQEDGAVRYTVAVSRSYKDEKKKWHSVHYFDRNDLNDVRRICGDAEEEILRVEGMTAEPQED